MIVKHNDQIQPWKPTGRTALIGGIVAAEAAVLVIVASEAPFLVPIVAGLGTSAIGAGIAALIAYLVSLRKGNSLGDLERDLAKAASIFERGLVDEAEYGRIKGQMLECYHYTRGSQVDISRAVRRGALLGLLGPVILMMTIYWPIGAGSVLLVSLATGVAGATVSGAGMAVLTYTRRQLARHQLGHGHHPLIDVSSQHKV